MVDFDFDDSIDRRPTRQGPRGEDIWFYPHFNARAEMDHFLSSAYQSTGGRLSGDPVESEAVKHFSLVTRLRVAEYHHMIHAPRSLQMRNCTRSERICSVPVDSWLPICAGFFRVGLRFPIPKFILDVLEYHSIAINQLPPNSMRYLIAFMSKCRLLGIIPTVDLFHTFFVSSTATHVTSDSWGYCDFRPRTSFDRILGACPSRNSNYRSRYFFVRNHPDEPPLQFPVRWRTPTGTRVVRPFLASDHPSVIALSRFAVQDATILCSLELTAYLGIFPRKLSDSIFFFIPVCFCADQVVELRQFIYGPLVKYTSLTADTGLGPFVTHCGLELERIPTMCGLISLRTNCLLPGIFLLLLMVIPPLLP